MDAEIINVGTELLIGDQVSNNQQFLVSELANIDVNVYCSNTAGFDPARLRELLAISLTRSDVIIIVGGMGPNIEDITKQTVCDALGLSLVRHEVSQKRIEEYCAHNGIQLNEIIISMADMPAGSVVFRNDNGMCPGCAIRSSKQCIVMLPSSQVEMAPMVRSYVLQYLRQLTDGAVFSQVVNIFSMGINLHTVEERLGALLESSNPTVKCVEMTGEVRVRVTAKTSSEESSRELAAPVIRQIVEIFGKDAYGMNVSGIEEVVVKELKERKMTVSTAESCTAGIISKRITDIPGSSRVFEMGAATYSSNKKSDMLGVSDKIIQRYGAVSPEAAAAMAVGARKLAGSTLAVSTTGIAGPGGGTPLKPVGLVYIGLADKEHVWIRKTLIQKPGMDRDYVRQVAASHALNLIRMYIDSLPYLMPGCERLGEGVRESYFDNAAALSPQAVKNLALSAPIASMGQSPQYSDIVSSAQKEITAAANRVPMSVQPAVPTPAGYGAQQGQQRYSQPGQPGYGRAPQGGYGQPGYGGQRPGGYGAPTATADNGKKSKAKKKAAKKGSVMQNSNAKKKANGRDVFQRVLFFIALLVFLGSGGYLAYNYLISPYMTESVFDEFRDSYTNTDMAAGASNGLWLGSVSDDPARNEDNTLKSFDTLRQLNSDIVGWVTVPNTVIDYPVVQYTDDDYYLHRNIYGEQDKNGTIFVHYRVPIAYGINPPVTILFGHHMRSGIMFANLMKYDAATKSSGLEFYKSSPVITYNTIYENGEWVVFSVMKLNTLEAHGEVFKFVRSEFINDEDFMSYINEIRQRSVIDTYNCIDVNAMDQLLILSTCSYEYSEFRTVVVARKIRAGETSIDVSSAVKAANPKMPDVWGT